MPDQDICTDLGDKDLDLVLSLLLQLEEWEVWQGEIGSFAFGNSMVEW